MIRLVVDSTCDMPQSLIEKYKIAVLPLQVLIKDSSYRDGCDIQIEQLYKLMREGIQPKTSQIDYNETESLFRGICETGDDFIYLAFSSGMSGTCQLAQMIVRELQGEYPQINMRVIDSEGGCVAAGLVAIQAARWIAGGMAYPLIVERMISMIAQVQHLFTLNSLEWLAKGGRLIRPVGFVGDKLHIKPILDVKDKTMHITRLVQGRKRTISTIVELLCDRIQGFPCQLIGIAHADDPELAKQVELLILSALPQSKTLILPIGCALGSHLGIGGIGMFFFKEPVEGYDLLSETGIE